MKKSIFIFLIALFITVQAFAQASFSAKTDFSTNNQPYYLTGADFNKDGKQDLVVVYGDASSTTISVFLNTASTGASSPSFSSATSFTVSGQQFSVSTGDFNGDGFPDLAVGNSGNVSVLLNTTSPGAATPTFSTAVNFSIGATPYTIAIGDLNGDGKPDIAATNYGGGLVSVILNTTSGGASVPTFSTKTDFSTGAGAIGVSIGDINKDGIPDLLVTNDGASNVSILLNTTSPGAGTPTFATSTNISVGNLPRSGVLTDFNGDGKPDIVVGIASAAKVKVLLNTTTPGSSTPSFTSGTDFAVTGANSISTVDLNGDGLPDITTSHTGNLASVLLNTTSPGSSTPSFLTKADFTTGNYPNTVFVSDLNGDGKPDIVSTNYSDNTFSVLFNTMNIGTTPANFSAKTVFTALKNPYFVGSGDLNLDGKPDLVMGYRDGTDSISVFLSTTNPGDAIPSFSTREDFNIGARPFAAAIGDLNGDGKPDIVVANTSGFASVFINETNPGAASLTLSARADFSTYGGPWFVQLADVNGDGKPDILAVQTSFPGKVSVLLNTTTSGSTTPSFSAYSAFTVGTYSTCIAIGDFNLDGKPDFVVANDANGAATNSDYNSLSVLLNTTTTGAATATFSTKTNFKVKTNPTTVFVADINGDGKPDLVSSNSGSLTVSVLLNTTTPGATTPTFSDTTDFTTGSGTFNVYMGDVNGDGKPDIVTSNPNDNTVSVLLNTTSPGASIPSFATKTDFATAKNPSFVTIQDLNGDGKPDLAVADQNDSTLSVLFNSVSLPLPVELVSFNANVEGSSVVMSWQTATEVNNYGFEVQRGISSQKTVVSSWEKIGFVAGAGNSNSPHNYSFTDQPSGGTSFSYRIKQIDNDGHYKYYDAITVTLTAKQKAELMDNYPNPFNPTTAIKFYIPNNSDVSIKIYDIIGREVTTLINKQTEAGYHIVYWNGRDSYGREAASGVYIYRLTAGAFAQTKKMALLK